MSVPNFELPDISTLLDGNIFDLVEKIFNLIFGLIVSLVEYVVSFVSLLWEINSYISDMVTSVNNGSVEGLPILQTIGAYRFLVGDTIFNLSYLFIVTGCFFTLYKLCLIMYRRYKESKTDITTKGNSVSGILSLVEKFFK